MSNLVLTIGDPTGIGSEITAKALQRLAEFPATIFSVIGDIEALKKAAQQLDLTLPESKQTNYLNISAEKSGAVAYQAIDKAAQMLAAGEADALVTGPISKHNLRDAGHEFAGHTEILEDMAKRYFNVPDARAEMLFVYKYLRLLLLTRHIALADVPAALAKTGAVAKPIRTLITHLRQQVGIMDARIAILAVNPHAGEVGGEEEKKYLLPVIHAVNGIGNSQLDGPFAADGFFRSLDPADIKHDAIVAMYHDQGLIPFKMIAGYEAVNVTIGLPFIRTSVSHGTAEDIVGKGIAREDSLIAAIHAANAYVRQAQKP